MAKKKTPADESAIKSPEPVYYDWQQRERAEEFAHASLATYLGRKYGDLEVGLRSFFDNRVVVRREAVESELRMHAELDDTEELSGEDGIRLSRATVLAALTWAKGEVKTSEKLADVAKKAGLKVREDGVLLFTGDEDKEAVRAVFGAMLAGSTKMLLVMLRATKALHELDDAEICRLGEGSTFGRGSGAVWQD